MLRYLGSITCSPSESRNNTQGIRAQRDFGPQAGSFDSILRAVTGGTAGNGITVALTGDSAPAAGVTISRVLLAFVIHYESGVSTIGNVETAIAALAGADDLIEVKTAGTGATVLTAVGDNIAAVALTGGVAGFTLPSTTGKIGLLTTAASQAVEVKADATEPSTFTTTSAASGTGVPLTANTLREVLMQSASADNVVAVFNGDAAEQSVRVYAMVR
jgi:hypothetical protein